MLLRASCEGIMRLRPQNSESIMLLRASCEWQECAIFSCASHIAAVLLILLLCTSTAPLGMHQSSDSSQSTPTAASAPTYTSSREYRSPRRERGRGPVMREPSREPSMGYRCMRAVLHLADDSRDRRLGAPIASTASWFATTTHHA
jgi:hypothetical protein